MGVLHQLAHERGGRRVLDGRSDADLHRRAWESLRRPTWLGGRGGSLRCTRIGPSPLTHVSLTDVGTCRKTHARRGRGQGRRDVRKGGGRSGCYHIAPRIPIDAEVAVPTVAQKIGGR